MPTARLPKKLLGTFDDGDVKKLLDSDNEEIKVLAELLLKVHRQAVENYEAERHNAKAIGLVSG